MAIKRGSRYFCPICNKEFPNSNLADIHRDTEHDIVYVPMERSEIGRLIQFIFSKDDSLLSPNLVLVLRNVMKNSTRIQRGDE